jgi:hypothetical protein
MSETELSAAHDSRLGITERLLGSDDQILLKTGGSCRKPVKFMAEIAAKEEQYREYVRDHQRNVTAAWLRLRGRAVTCPTLIATVDRLVAIHDDSKFSPEEFDPYRRFFYPAYPDEKSHEEFRWAFAVHWSRNPHHPEFWVDRRSEFADRQPYLVEMVCDWMAMGMHFGNLARDWYHQRKTKIRLPDADRAFIEGLLAFE